MTGDKCSQPSVSHERLNLELSITETTMSPAPLTAASHPPPQPTDAGQIAHITRRKIFNPENILIITPYIVDDAGPHCLVCSRVQLHRDVGVRAGHCAPHQAQPTFEYKELCCGWRNVC